VQRATTLVCEATQNTQTARSPGKMKKPRERLPVDSALLCYDGTSANLDGVTPRLSTNMAPDFDMESAAFAQLTSYHITLTMIK
jgi:hypothetical protein